MSFRGPQEHLVGAINQMSGMKCGFDPLDENLLIGIKKQPENEEAERPGHAYLIWLDEALALKGIDAGRKGYAHELTIPQDDLQKKLPELQQKTLCEKSRTVTLADSKGEMVFSIELKEHSAAPAEAELAALGLSRIERGAGAAASLQVRVSDFGKFMVAIGLSPDLNGCPKKALVLLATEPDYQSFSWGDAIAADPVTTWKAAVRENADAGTPAAPSQMFERAPVAAAAGAGAAVVVTGAPPPVA